MYTPARLRDVRQPARTPVVVRSAFRRPRNTFNDSYFLFTKDKRPLRTIRKRSSKSRTHPPNVIYVHTREVPAVPIDYCSSKTKQYDFTAILYNDRPPKPTRFGWIHRPLKRTEFAVLRAPGGIERWRAFSDYKRGQCPMRSSMYVVRVVWRSPFASDVVFFDGGDRWHNVAYIARAQGHPRFVALSARACRWERRKTRICLKIKKKHSGRPKVKAFRVRFLFVHELGAVVIIIHTRARARALNYTEFN